MTKRKPVARHKVVRNGKTFYRGKGAMKNRSAGKEFKKVKADAEPAPEKQSAKLTKAANKPTGVHAIEHANVLKNLEASAAASKSNADFWHKKGKPEAAKKHEAAHKKTLTKIDKWKAKPTFGKESPIKKSHEKPAGVHGKDFKDHGEKMAYLRSLRSKINSPASFTKVTKHLSPKDTREVLHGKKKKK